MAVRNITNKGNPVPEQLSLFDADTLANDQRQYEAEKSITSAPAYDESGQANLFSDEYVQESSKAYEKAPSKPSGPKLGADQIKANFQKQYAADQDLSIQDFFDRDTKQREKFENVWDRKIKDAEEAAKKDGSDWEAKKKELNEQRNAGRERLNTTLNNRTNAYIDAKVGTETRVQQYQDMIKEYQAAGADREAMLKSNKDLNKLVENGIINKDGTWGEGYEEKLTEHARSEGLNDKANKRFRKSIDKVAEKQERNVAEGFSRVENNALQKAANKSGSINWSKLGKYGTVGAVAVGALATAGLVFSMSDSRGAQSNAQLYGQTPAYAN